MGDRRGFELGHPLQTRVRERLNQIRARVAQDHERRFEEHLTLARGFIEQNRFEKARQELSRARELAAKAFSGYGIEMDTRRVSKLRAQAESQEEAYRSRVFEEKYELARSRFDSEDYAGGYRVLEEAREFGNQEQLARADSLASQYNAPPEVKIVVEQGPIYWEAPV